MALHGIRRESDRLPAGRVPVGIFFAVCAVFARPYRGLLRTYKHVHAESSLFYASLAILSALGISLRIHRPFCWKERNRAYTNRGCSSSEMWAQFFVVSALCAWASAQVPHRPPTWLVNSSTMRVCLSVLERLMVSPGAGQTSGNFFTAHHLSQFYVGFLGAASCRATTAALLTQFLQRAGLSLTLTGPTRK